MEILKIINVLIKNLPNNDIELGYKFLKERDFESLLELVESDIIKIKKDKTDKYKDINIDNLYKLKSETESYYTRIEPNFYTDINDFEDNIIEEEFY